MDALGSDVAQWRSLSVADLRACLKDWRARRKEMRDWSIEHGEAFEFLSCPSAEIVYALISVLDERRLSAIVDRFKHHRSTHRSGVPDLFLFATDNTGRPCMARFIEVKKYDEDVSLVQKEVIAFLQSLGLTAAVLVLREPATAKRRLRTSRGSLSASPTTTGREDVTT